MLALRLASLFALTIWMGGLVALGAVAAPAIFAVVEIRQIPDGRALAGAIFGEILRRFHLVSYACGGIVLASLVARAVLGPRPRRFALRAGVAAIMLLAAAYAGVVVTARVERLRQEIGGAPSSLREGDPRRTEFDRLHSRATALQVVPLLGGLVLLIGELGD
jgi:hypothetical protein